MTDTVALTQLTEEHSANSSAQDEVQLTEQLTETNEEGDVSVTPESESLNNNAEQELSTSDATSIEEQDDLLAGLEQDATEATSEVSQDANIAKESEQAVSEQAEMPQESTSEPTDSPVSEVAPSEQAEALEQEQSAQDEPSTQDEQSNQDELSDASSQSSENLSEQLEPSEQSTEAESNVSTESTETTGETAETSASEQSADNATENQEQAQSSVQAQEQDNTSLEPASTSDASLDNAPSESNVETTEDALSLDTLSQDANDASLSSDTDILSPQAGGSENTSEQKSESEESPDGVVGDRGASLFDLGEEEPSAEQTNAEQPSVENAENAESQSTEPQQDAPLLVGDEISQTVESEDSPTSSAEAGDDTPNVAPVNAESEVGEQELSAPSLESIQEQVSSESQPESILTAQTEQDIVASAEVANATDNKAEAEAESPDGVQGDRGALLFDFGPEEIPVESAETSSEGQVAPVEHTQAQEQVQATNEQTAVVSEAVTQEHHENVVEAQETAAEQTQTNEGTETVECSTSLVATNVSESNVADNNVALEQPSVESAELTPVAYESHAQAQEQSVMPQVMAVNTESHLGTSLSVVNGQEADSIESNQTPVENKSETDLLAESVVGSDAFNAPIAQQVQGDGVTFVDQVEHADHVASPTPLVSPDGQVLISHGQSTEPQYYAEQAVLSTANSFASGESKHLGVLQNMLEEIKSQYSQEMRDLQNRLEQLELLVQHSNGESNELKLQRSLNKGSGAEVLSTESSSKSDIDQISEVSSTSLNPSAIKNPHAEAIMSNEAQANAASFNNTSATVGEQQSEPAQGSMQGGIDKMQQNQNMPSQGNQAYANGQGNYQQNFAQDGMNQGFSGNQQGNAFNQSAQSNFGAFSSQMAQGNAFQGNQQGQFNPGFAQNQQGNNQGNLQNQFNQGFAQNQQGNNQGNAQQGQFNPAFAQNQQGNNQGNAQQGQFNQGFAQNQQGNNQGNSQQNQFNQGFNQNQQGNNQSNGQQNQFNQSFNQNQQSNNQGNGQQGQFNQAFVQNNQGGFNQAQFGQGRGFNGNQPANFGQQNQPYNQGRGFNNGSNYQRNSNYNNNFQGSNSNGSYGNRRYSGGYSNAPFQDNGANRGYQNRSYGSYNNNGYNNNGSNRYSGRTYVNPSFQNGNNRGYNNQGQGGFQSNNNNYNNRSYGSNNSGYNSNQGNQFGQNQGNFNGNANRSFGNNNFSAPNDQFAQNANQNRGYQNGNGNNGNNGANGWGNQSNQGQGNQPQQQFMPQGNAQPNNFGNFNANNSWPQNQNSFGNNQGQAQQNNAQLNQNWNNNQGMSNQGFNNQGQWGNQNNQGNANNMGGNTGFNGNFAPNQQVRPRWESAVNSAQQGTASQNQGFYRNGYARGAYNNASNRGGFNGNGSNGFNGSNGSNSSNGLAPYSNRFMQGSTVNSYNNRVANYNQSRAQGAYASQGGQNQGGFGRQIFIQTAPLSYLPAIKQRLASLGWQIIEFDPNRRYGPADIVLQSDTRFGQASPNACLMTPYNYEQVVAFLRNVIA